MRFGRLILASLAPLIGLSALTAVMATGPAVSSEHKSNSLTRRLLLTVVTPLDESSALNVRPERPSPQAVLPVAALAVTPLKHSVWLISSRTVLPFSSRSQHRDQLRC